MKNRTGVMVLLVFLAATMAACAAKSVRFDRHAPYHAPVSYDDPLVIVVPDAIETETFAVTLPGGFMKRKFDVYYGEALRYEAHARFAKTFSDVAIIEETAFEDAMNGDGIGTVLDRQSGLDAVGLEDPAETERDEEQQILDEINFVPEYVSREDGYLLRFHDVKYGFSDGRSMLLMAVTFEDRFLGEILIEGRIRGYGSSVSGAESSDLVVYRLNESVISAYSETLNRLRDQMVDAIEGKK